MCFCWVDDVFLEMRCVVEKLLFPICLAKKKLDIDMTSSGRYWGLSLQKCLPETAFEGNSFPSEKKEKKEQQNTHHLSAKKNFRMCS